MNPLDDELQRLPEWLQRDPDEEFDRNRFRARVWRWLVFALALFWLGAAALVLLVFPVLP